MKLTPLQIEMINHRLEIPTAMADVLSDSTGMDFDVALDLIELRTGTLIEKLQSGSPLDDIEKHMVEDIATDPSYLSCAESAMHELWPDPSGTLMTEIRFSNFIKSHDSLHDKLMELV